MTKDETLKVLAILKAAYPSAYKDMTQREAQGTVTVWSMQFYDVPGDIVLMAVQKLISTNKFPPAISEVKDKISRIHWEAYETLNPRDDIAEGLMPEKDKIRLKWILDNTRSYKNQQMGEPRLYDMIVGNQMLQIGNDPK